MRLFLTTLLLLALASTACGGNLDFTLHKLDSGRPGPTILVIGGIQGDEPGGFYTAALLVSHYKITSGAVWVVPNLNFLSMIHNSRGMHGDMNRKFADLDPKDPEYEAIQKIKAIITDPRVSAVLHLHDGWGFYSPTYVSEWQNPKRWGQSVIIDQPSVDAAHFGDLAALADKAVADANERLYDPMHAYHVKNTHTRELDDETAKEMSKTLTYFAINHGKPAFGIEGSKNVSAFMSAYYHLAVVESFLRSFGIGFERTFDLTTQNVADALQSNVAVSFFDNKVTASGHLRGEQRKLYDAQKATMIPEQGLTLLIIDYRDFQNVKGKIVRNYEKDLLVVARMIKDVLPQPVGDQR